jgi:hypothetical protein
MKPTSRLSAWRILPRDEINIRNVIATLPLLRNWYIGYIVVVFWVGGLVLGPSPSPLVIDGVIYIVTFLLGYWLWCRWSKSGPRRAIHARFTLRTYIPVVFVRWCGSPVGALVGRVRAHSPLEVLRRLLILLLLARLGVIVYEVFFVYGLKEYFSGAALVFQIKDYGRFDVASGWFVILSNALNITTVAACACYLTESLVQKSAPRFDLVVALMVIVPILNLQRSFVLFGVAFVGVAYVFSARVRGEQVLARVSATAIAGILALGLGVYVGLLREDGLNPGSANGQLAGRVWKLAEGEMSPIVVYAAFRADVGRIIDYQYGRSILGPLVFKVVPRNWYPNKPTNSAAFYASHYQPAAFAAGFAIAPTLWGALYLNFGYFGTVMGSLVLGVVTARLDSVYLQGRIVELKWFLIVYYNYYTLLRDDISNVLGLLLLTGAVVLILQWATRPAAESDPTNGLY